MTIWAGWSWLLTAGGVFGLWLAGRKLWQGWAVGIAMQALWVTYAVVTQQFGFIISAFAYGSVYVYSLRRWRRQDAADADVPD